MFTLNSIGERRTLGATVVSGGTALIQPEPLHFEVHNDRVVRSEGSSVVAVGRGETSVTVRSGRLSAQTAPRVFQVPAYVRFAAHELGFTRVGETRSL